MKVNVISSRIHQQGFKAQSQKNHMDLKFHESDMENGSIVGALAGMAIAGLYLTKTNLKNTSKNYLLKGGLVAFACITLGELATLGAITIVKIIKENKKNKVI